MTGDPVPDGTARIRPEPLRSTEDRLAFLAQHLAAVERLLPPADQARLAAKFGRLAEGTD